MNVKHFLETNDTAELYRAANALGFQLKEEFAEYKLFTPINHPMKNNGVYVSGNEKLIKELLVFLAVILKEAA